MIKMKKDFATSVDGPVGRSVAAIVLCLWTFLLGPAAFANESPEALADLPSAQSLEFLLESKDPSDPEAKHSFLDKVFSFSHRVPYEPGRSIFVTEFFSLRSVLRHPARAVVFLTGPEFRGDFWSIPVEGYNGPEMAARRGFYAYTLDYVGVGESYIPPDGSQVNYLTQVKPIRTLIDLVRRSRRVGRVDLVGEGMGSEIASHLADEPWRVRSVVLSVAVYRDFDPAILPFFSPEFEAFLRSQPGGYWQPDFLDLTLAFSPNEELREYVFATQPGMYPTGPALQFWDFEKPTIDADDARVPALIIEGELDPFPAPGDMSDLAGEWGDDATLVVIPGANHVPRIEAEEIADQFFEALFTFLDAP